MQNVNNDGSAAKNTLKVFLEKQTSTLYFKLLQGLFLILILPFANWAIRFVPEVPTAVQILWAAPESAVDLKALDPLMQLILAILIAAFILHLWWNFTQVLIYVKEDNKGEAVSFGFALVVIISLSMLPNFWRYWTVILGICLLGVFVKVSQVYKFLRATSPDHPLVEHTREWMRSSLAYATLLFLAGAVTIDRTSWEFVLAILGALTLSARVLIGWGPFQRKLEADMIDYISSHPDEFEN